MRFFAKRVGRSRSDTAPLIRHNPRRGPTLYARASLLFTKPGSDSFRGEFLAQYNNRFLNARNPLLTESRRHSRRCYPV